jgi:hypothetical protein
VLGVQGQPVLRHAQRFLEPPLVEMNRAKEEPVVGIRRVQTDGFLGGDPRVVVAVPLVPDLRQRVVREREVGRAMNRLPRLVRRVVGLLALDQAERQQRVGVRVAGIRTERLAELGLRHLIAGLLIEEQAALDTHLSFRYVRMSS